MRRIEGIARRSLPALLCVVGASCALGCSTASSGAADKADGAIADAGSADAPTSDATVPFSFDASDDAPLQIVCPPNPPVNLDAIPGFKAQCTRVAFVAGGGNDNRIEVAFDDAGADWGNEFSIPDSGQNASVNNVVFGLGFGLAVGSNDSLLTANATSWTAPDSGVPSNGFGQAVAFLDSMFLYVGRGRGSGYSFTGTSWQNVTSGNPYTTGALATFAGAQVAYGETNADAGTGVFVVVGTTSGVGADGGSVPVVAGYRTSTDGQNWSDDIPITNSAGQSLGGYLSSVAFGNGHFVMVGTGNGNPAPNADGLLAWSTDGAHWTVSTNADRDAGGAMAFSEVARSDTTFIAASNRYSAGGHWASTDGEHWTVVSTGPGFDHLQGFESNFIGGGVQSQKDGVVSVSTDNGQTWTLQTAFADRTPVTSIGIGRILKGP